MADVLHLCAGFGVIMGALYLWAMRSVPGRGVMHIVEKAAVVCLLLAAFGR